MNENIIPMRIEGGEIQVKATLGQTVIKVVAPDEYVGDTTVTPSDETQVLSTKDKLVRDNITVNPAPTEPLAISENGAFVPSSGNVGFSSVTVDVKPVLESLSVTENGLYLPESGIDGFDRVLVNTDIQWDGTLYPVTDESDALYADHVFNAKHISVVAGDTVIVEGMGRGRWFGWYRGVKGGDYASNSTTYSPMANNGFGKARYTLPITADATLVLCGYEWTNDGTHSGNATYCFFGEYLRWKVIHAS